ncbi:MAG: hypothetical protein R3268_12495, partial [Acidiferrobacterales bacterium]|nr:hypothetical protein [Acidiferrobacterales bacterium]
MLPCLVAVIIVTLGTVILVRVNATLTKMHGFLFVGWRDFFAALKAARRRWERVLLAGLAILQVLASARRVVAAVYVATVGPAAV